MFPTINADDHVKIAKNFDELTYGDLVMYNYEVEIVGNIEQRTTIARIIGLPEDSIGIKNGTTIINGKNNSISLIRKGIFNKEINELFRKDIEEYQEIMPNGVKFHILIYHSETIAYRNLETIKIPGNHYFLMGDFRDYAMDSRHFGPIPKEKIIGKVIKITPKKK
jgi:signal peptidase I